jgi:DNA-binding XRE family transcriptional regulator
VTRSRPSDYGSAVARKKQTPVSEADRTTIGSLLRELRRGAGYRSVERAAAEHACPASRQTIYAYERGRLVPSLVQFLELAEFYVLEAPRTDDGAKPEADLRSLGVATVARALTLEAYHVARAQALMAKMQPRLRNDRS